MIDWRDLTRTDWIEASVIHKGDAAFCAPNRRDFINRGCAVFEAGFEPPPGWVHVERDDELGWFDSDEQAAANVSDRWALFAPRTGVIYVGSTKPHKVDLYRGGIRRDTVEEVDPPECAASESTGYFRVIVPIADAITAGLLTEEACRICGADGSDICFERCTRVIVPITAERTES